MKKSKLRVIIAIFVITFLILGSVGSFGISNVENKTYNKTNTMVRNSAVGVNTIYLDEDFNSKNINILGNKDNNSIDNIVVTNETVNEYYPSMIREGYNSLVAYESENNSETSIYLRYSKNYGQEWSSQYLLNAKLNDNPIEINSPSLSLIPLSTRAYGMYTSPLKNSAVFGYFDVSNIVDPSTINTYTFDWTGFNGGPGITYAFWDFDTPQIITYKNTVTPWVIALTGSTNFTDAQGVGPCTDSPMFCFRDLDDPENFVTLTWFSEIEHCSNIMLARNFSGKIIYGVCEINNGSNQDLLFFKGNPTEWYNGQFTNRTFTSPNSLTHPHINQSKDDIYIVADSDSDGIVLYHSNNFGNNWTIKNVTANILNESADPSYPMIYANDVNLICTYIESNNISLISSTDKGNTWSDPIQLNNRNESVVEGYRYSNLVDNNHILWTDNRNGNNDIFSVLLDVPEVDLSILPESVALETEYSNVPLIRSKNWITFTIKNNGNISVEKVNVKITYLCSNSTPKMTDYQATIYYLYPGNEESFRRPLFRLTLGEFINALINYAGIETITIEIEDKYEDAFPPDNSYTISVTFKEIFPRFGFLEPILKLF